MIFRVASRSAHPTTEGIDPWAEQLPEDRVLIKARADEAPFNYAALSIPLLAMALVVSHHVLGWPNEDKVREINEAMVATPDGDE